MKLLKNIKNKIGIWAFFCMILNYYFMYHFVGFNGIAYITIPLILLAAVNLVLNYKISNAVGYVIKVRVSKGQYKNANQFKHNVLFYQLFLSILVAFVLFLLSDKICVGIFHCNYSTITFIILSVAVVIHSIVTILNGYLIGEGFESIVSILNLMKQCIIAVLCFAFCKGFNEYGQKVSDLLGQQNFIYMYGCIGIGLAIAVSELIILLVTTVVCIIRRDSQFGEQDSLKTVDRMHDSVRIMYNNRGFEFGLFMILLIPFVTCILFLLKQSFTRDDAFLQYGMLLFGFSIIISLPLSGILGFNYVALRRIAQFYRKNEYRHAKNIFGMGVHFNIIYSVYFAGFFVIASKYFIPLITSEYQDVFGNILNDFSFVLILLCPGFLFTETMLKHEKNILVAVGLLIADIIYIAASAILSKGGNGVLSFTYAAIITVFLYSLIMGCIVYREMRTRMDWLQNIIIPLLIAVLSDLIIYLSGAAMVPHMGYLVTTLLLFIIYSILYWFGLILLHNIREGELELIPGGRIMQAIGQMLRVY